MEGKNRLKKIAFLMGVMVIFVDTMGIAFSIPILVPFGDRIGGNAQVVGAGGSIRFAFSIVSLVWMSKMADKKGTRIVALLSLIGSALSYVVQGLAMWVGKIPMWLLGRALAGFFGGTQSVINAYITKITMPNARLLKKRLTLLMVGQQGIQIALFPLCGLVAMISLNAPYFVCTGVALIGFWIALGGFKNADQLVQEENEANPNKQHTPTHEEKEMPKDTKPGEEEKPAKDPVIRLLFVCMLFVFLFAMGYMILIPIMMEEDSFGLQGDDDDETQENIASMFSFLMMPNGFASVTCSTFFYVPLTNNLGERPVIGFFGLILTASVGAMGFWPEEVWHIAVLQVGVGTGLGFLTPAIPPVQQRYVGHFYKKKTAEAGGIPNAGLFIAALLSQLLFATLEAEAGREPSWVFAASCCLIFTIFFLYTSLRVDALLPPPDPALEPEKLMGMKVDKFIDVMCKELLDTLEDEKEELWNEPIKHIVRQNVATVVPPLRPWDDKTDGYEYLTDLKHLIDGGLADLERHHRSLSGSDAIRKSLDE